MGNDLNRTKRRLGNLVRRRMELRLMMMDHGRRFCDSSEVQKKIPRRCGQLLPNASSCHCWGSPVLCSVTELLMLITRAQSKAGRSKDHFTVVREPLMPSIPLSMNLIRICAQQKQMTPSSDPTADALPVALPATPEVLSTPLRPPRPANRRGRNWGRPRELAPFRTAVSRGRAKRIGTLRSLGDGDVRG